MQRHVVVRFEVFASLGVAIAYIERICVLNRNVVFGDIEVILGLILGYSSHRIQVKVCIVHYMFIGAGFWVVLVLLFAI
jgi:hypothetical protein